MSMVFDEYGRPFIILKEQQAKSRIKGLQAQKHNIMAAETSVLYLAVPRCCGAFTPSTRVVSGRGGRGWSHFRF